MRRSGSFVSLAAVRAYCGISRPIYQLSELTINTLCACVMKSKVSVWKSIALVATLIGLCLLFRQDSGPTGLIR